MDLKSKIREIPDFPKKGILFYDITTLLLDSVATAEVNRQLAAPYAGKTVNKVVAVESRGFIFGAPVAERLNAGFVPVRKPGKSPADFIQEDYDLEYGSNSLCLHKDAISEGDQVIIVDDLLATGGTLAASINLVEKLGGQIVGISVVIELLFLKGRGKLGQHPVHSVLNYR